jgi:hypothetical protein
MQWLNRFGTVSCNLQNGLKKYAIEKKNRKKENGPVILPSLSDSHFNKFLFNFCLCKEARVSEHLFT